MAYVICIYMSRNDQPNVGLKIGYLSKATRVKCVDVPILQFRLQIISDSQREISCLK